MASGELLVVSLKREKKTKCYFKTWGMGKKWNWKFCGSSVPIVGSDLERGIIGTTAGKQVVIMRGIATPTHVHSHDVLTDQSIAFFFAYISDEEYHIES